MPRGEYANNPTSSLLHISDDPTSNNLFNKEYGFCMVIILVIFYIFKNFIIPQGFSLKAQRVSNFYLDQSMTLKYVKSPQNYPPKNHYNIENFCCQMY